MPWERMTSPPTAAPGRHSAPTSSTGSAHRRPAPAIALSNPWIMVSTPVVPPPGGPSASMPRQKPIPGGYVRETAARQRHVPNGRPLTETGQLHTPRPGCGSRPRDPFTSLSFGQSGGEAAAPGRIDPLLQLRQRTGEVPVQQRAGSEAQSREPPAVDDSSAIAGQWAVLAVRQLAPLDTLSRVIQTMYSCTPLRRQACSLPCMSIDTPLAATSATRSGAPSRYPDQGPRANARRAAGRLRTEPPEPPPKALPGGDRIPAGSTQVLPRASSSTSS